MNPQNLKFQAVSSNDQSERPTVEIIENPPPVPPAATDRVARMMAQRVEREQMKMAASWAREAAKNRMQANLDIHRAVETARIALTVGDHVREKLAELDAKTERSVAANPNLELDYREMEADTAELLKQLNRVTAVAYWGRYHRS